ncbi:MAG: NifU N-terminal domain-containing protein [Acidimicrobiales bacterium]
MDHDAARRLVVERNLVAAAFGHLTDAFTSLPFEALGPVKTLLKRYLSTGPWGPEDDHALAEAVGGGEGWWRRELDADVALEFGWDTGRFRVRLLTTAATGETAVTPDPLAATFDGPVVPEATPNPRTIRFAFGHPVHDGPSRWYESAAAAGDDPRAGRLFSEFDRVANVLVGPDFVAVGLRRPGDWEELLAPVLAVVTEEFADPEDGTAARPSGAAGGPAWLSGGVPPAAREGRRLTRLEQAWQDLGALRPADPSDLARVVAAASDADQARRQVAANLLREADPAVARAEWARLVVDPVRGVRRAAVDAMVDAGREELRPLLESALDDADAWVRWKSLRGLAELGPAPSRSAIAAKAEDPDFRVRLEAAAALRAG